MRWSRAAWFLALFLMLLSGAALSSFMQIDIDSVFSDWDGAENVSDASADQPQTRVLSLWNVTYSNASWDYAYAVAADTSGRVFVAGLEIGAGGGQGDTYDWRIMALNATDGTSFWNVTYSNASNDIAYAVAADTSGRVFVAGVEIGAGGGQGETPDWRIMALNATDGTSFWNVTYSNASDDYAYAVAADTSGRVFVAGSETGAGGGQGDTTDWRIMALNATDGTSLWNVTYSNASGDEARAVAADTSGRVFVAGLEETYDWRIMALDATDGTSLWNVTYSNASEDYAYAVAADTSGRVFVAGIETGVGGGYSDDIMGATPDWRIMALNATDGASLWNVTYSNASEDYAYAVAADTSGRVFVAGLETGAGGGQGDTPDWRIMALDATDGTSLWNVTYSNASTDIAYAVAADTSGRVFVAGFERGAGGGYGYTYTSDWRIMALQHVDGVSASFDLSDIGLAHNATHLNAYMRVSNNIDFSDGGRYYRFFVSTDFSEGNDTTPEGETLPFNYSFRVQVNGSVCTLFNYTHPNSGTPDCSFANASQEMEIQVRLDTLNLSLGDSINVSFETGNASQRFDLAPDLPGYVNYTRITVEDQSAPVISGTSASVSWNDATLTWTTDDSANSSATVGSSSFTSATLTTSHSVAVSGLTSGTAYTATLRSCNTDNYCGTGSLSFTTSSSAGVPAGAGAAPQPSSAVVIQSIAVDTPKVIEVSKADEIGVSEIRLEVKNEVSNVEVKVAKLAEQPSSVTTSASANVYRYLEVTTKRLASADIKQVKFDFKVERSWLAEKAVQAKDVVLLRYAGGKWSELSTQQTSSDTTYAYFTATSPGFSVFAIGTRAAAAEEPATPPVTPPEVPPEQPPTGEVITPPVTPPVEPPAKGFFQSALFTIAVGTVLAVTGVGFIYRNRLTIGARIDDLLGKLKRGRKERLKKK